MKYTLRPVLPSDASTILSLRNNSQRAQFLHPVSDDALAQENWIINDANRDDTRYFAITSDDGIEGFVGLTDVRLDRDSAEWGRWIIFPESRCAVASAFLIYEYCFEDLGLNRVYCRTISGNKQVVSFHDSCGLRRSAELRDHFEIAGEYFNAVEHSLTMSEWPELKSKLLKLASWSERSRH